MGNMSWLIAPKIEYLTSIGISEVPPTIITSPWLSLAFVSPRSIPAVITSHDVPESHD
jgi:hypothetical protein